MISYRYFPVHPALEDAVSMIAIMKSDLEESGLSPIYHFPWMNNFHLFFPLCDDPLYVRSGEETAFRQYDEAYFVGPKLVNDYVNFGKRKHVLGITFKPGAIHRILRIPARELVNVDVDATALWANAIRETEALLREAGNEAAQLAIVERFLFKITRDRADRSMFDFAIEELLKSNGNLSLKTFSDYACTSFRQMERLSYDRLGMSPKLFSRLIRFSKAYVLKESRPDITWTQIAHLSGYFDQMHMIRDFKQFSGTTPTQSFLQAEHSTKVMSVLEGY